MKCMYTIAPGHTDDCSEFIQGIYIDMLALSYVHIKLICMCGIYVVF